MLIFRGVTVTSWKRPQRHPVGFPTAGWRAIWVHPPAAGSVGAFDVGAAGPKASKGPVVPEAEVAKVAEAGGGRGW